MKRINVILKCGVMLLTVALVATITGCGTGTANSTADESTQAAESDVMAESDTEAESSVEAETETEADTTESSSAESETETTEGEAGEPETYPETVAAEEAAEDESQYFGVMYATVLSVTGSGTDATYTLVDKNNPEDSWTVTYLEIRADMTQGITADMDVAILFNGDVINDSENVSFLVVLPDGTYNIEKVTGTVTDNMMSTFALMTSDGNEMQFLKDNCRMDEGALELETANEITVYYADCGDLGNLPVRIYG